MFNSAGRRYIVDYNFCYGNTQSISFPDAVEIASLNDAAKSRALITIKQRPISAPEISPEAIYIQTSETGYEDLKGSWLFRTGQPSKRASQMAQATRPQIAQATQPQVVQRAQLRSVAGATYVNAPTPSSAPPSVPKPVPSQPASPKVVKAAVIKPQQSGSSAFTSEEVASMAAEAFLSAAPFAGGRAFGLTTRSGNVVRENAFVSEKIYQFDVRSLRCSPVKGGSKCSYQLQATFTGTIFGSRIASSNSGWVNRSDVFSGSGSSYKSATLNSYMRAWGERAGASSGQSGGGTENAAAKANEERRQKCLSDALDQGHMAICM